jgi:hypothetical protein
MVKQPRRPGKLLRKDIRASDDTGHTAADIEKMLGGTEGAQESAKPVRNLPRVRIVVAEKVFQWRNTREDVGARDDHILELANIIAATGEPLDPVLVFKAGDQFYIVDGHHRLAAYDTARWTKVIPVSVWTGSLEHASFENMRRNSKNTRNMSRKEKNEAAWKLGKRTPPFTREVIHEMTTVSPSTQDGMRRMLKKLRDAETEGIDEMTYAQALGKQWADEGSPKFDADTWLSEKADKLAKKMEDHGIGFLLRENHEVAAMALLRVDARLAKSLVSEWAFLPENREMLDDIVEEYNSVPPMKF